MFLRHSIHGKKRLVGCLGTLGLHVVSQAQQGGNLIAKCALASPARQVVPYRNFHEMSPCPPGIRLLLRRGRARRHCGHAIAREVWHNAKEALYHHELRAMVHFVLFDTQEHFEPRLA